MMQRRTDVWNQILALYVFREGRLFPCGTAFLVGKQLAMTATHVLDQPFNRRDYDPNDLDDCDFGVVAQQIIDRKEVPLLWRVTEMGRYPSLSESNDRRSTWGSLLLSHSAPFNQTSKITATGFSNSMLQRQRLVRASAHMDSRSRPVNHRQLNLSPFIPAGRWRDRRRALPKAR